MSARGPLPRPVGCLALALVLVSHAATFAQTPAPSSRSRAPLQTLVVRSTGGEFLEVIVDRPRDVVIRVQPVGGQVVAERDRVDPLDGPERVSWVANVAAEYRVMLMPRGAIPPADAPRARLAAQRQTTADDERRAQAERAYEQGERFRHDDTVDGFRRAIVAYQEALARWRSVGDRQGEADALLGVGLAHRSLSEYEPALAHLVESLQPRRAAGDHWGEAFTLQSIALIHRSQGEIDRARDYYTQALSLGRAHGDRRAEADGLNGLGRLSYELGEMQTALNYHAQALTIAGAIRDRRGEAYALNNAGVVYWAMGETSAALDRFSRALALRRALGDRRGEAASLSNAGMVYLDQGQAARSLDTHVRALALARTLGDRRLQGEILQEIGRARLATGDSAGAAQALAESVASCRAVGDRFCESASLDLAGKAEAALGRVEIARQRFDHAIDLARTQRDPVAQAQALSHRAALEDRAGNVVKAQGDVESALEIIESQRTKVLSPDLRASYLATTREAYELYIDLLMRRHAVEPTGGFSALALRASERARSRSLLDTLAEVRADIRTGVDPELLEQERALRQALNARADRLTTLLADSAGSRYEEVQRDVQDLIDRHRQVEADIRARSPQYALLMQPVTLGLDAIQRALGPDDVLLEYALGDRRSHLWVVTPQTMTAHELPGREIVERAAREAYDALQQSQRPGMRARAQAAARALGRLLLEKAAPDLADRRLIIVADGALQFVPFAALPSPRAGSRGQPLVVEHEIVMLPSASAIESLRAAAADRRRADRTLAVMADPVYQTGDPRVQSTAASSSRSTSSGNTQRAASDTVTASFERLSYTGAEARRIAALAPEHETLVATGFDATRSRVLADDLGRYRYVHFATHALVNTRHAELSGIVLSLVSPSGTPQDGFLRLHDIYNLRLGADLVVLSACQTALGRDVRGEGLIGLTRGFMYAGARGVVSSLWDVRDEQTSELMARFYRGMLREGLRPAAALRAAQRSMLADPAWSAPVYWAGFILQGEWREFF